MNRHQQQVAGFSILILIALIAVVARSATFTVDEAEQALVLQFGEIIGEPVTDPGLHFKVPFIQQVRRFDKRLLAWDGEPNQIPTSGREFIHVDTTARWRIADPRLFLESLKDEEGARPRLRDIIDSQVRDQIAATSLEEIVRSEGWDVSEADLEEGAIIDPERIERRVEIGREELVRRILENARRIMPQYGIELVDVRIKRLNYIDEVRKRVYDRMISERESIAERFLGEGREASEEILGEMERQLREIRSEAQREAQVIHGRSEAEATRIYNAAYSADEEFYAFHRSLETYGQSIGPNTTLFISSDTDLFRYLQHLSPSEALPAGAPASR